MCGWLGVNNARVHGLQVSTGDAKLVVHELQGWHDGVGGARGRGNDGVRVRNAVIVDASHNRWNVGALGWRR